MTPTSTPSTDLIPAGNSSSFPGQLPVILSQAGPAAIFATEEFFFGKIRNQHTRAAYLIAVRRFFKWAESRDLKLSSITPSHVGQYIDGLGKENTSVATRKQHLAALRHYFDGLVTRHAMVLNPALSVRGERYTVVEGKTPEITVDGARRLLKSMRTGSVVELRDRAIIAILIYTAARAGAVATLKRGSFYHAGDQRMLHFDEKNGKSREIPVRQDLERIVLEYLDATGLRTARKDTPLFRTAYKKTGQLTRNSMTAIDICRMVKRRFQDAGLSARLSPHSFRVTTITDLLEQGVPLEDVQRLAGHSDPRTTRLYDRRDRKITRNIVERISI
ncbi:MAG TPA: tyrosine-type recombinase/integrase [Bryobacteraceae bacterium]|nr:tyrosine-type recombinase/integrase [Bryobacteraceae bacterium]